MTQVTLNKCDRNPFVEVEKAEMTIGDKKTGKHGIMVHLQEDDKYDDFEEPVCVETVSDDYQLVKNRTVNQIAMDLLTRMETKFTEQRTMFNGKRYNQRWLIDDYSFEAKVGQVVGLGLQCFNSYDKTCQAGVSFYALVRQCSNGMDVDWLLGEFRFRHIGNGDFKNEFESAFGFLSTIQNTSNFAKFKTELRGLTKEEYDFESMQEMARNVPVSGRLSGEALLIAEEPTRWGLMNGYTNILSKKPSFANDSTNRQVMRHFLTTGL